jgi:CheY-like chemotaxis protein
MEAIGRLGAGVAHDFNNLLGAALATLDNLAALPPKTPLGDPEVEECLDDVRAAALRATELTKRLLRFSRRESMATDAVDVSKLCLEVIQLVRRTVDRSIEVVGDVAPRLKVDGHAGELHQLLMNLCINARDAMPDGGKLTIAAQLVPEEALVGLPIQQRLPHVALRVSDTGRGIDRDTLEKVFEPFFTTKAKEAGAGLGLATVFDVATSHGGTVTIDSQPGEGTSVRVFLPARPRKRAHRRTPTAAQEAATKPAFTDAAEILIVDDQALVRRSWGRLLRRAGHTVRIAEDGQQALDELAAKPPDLMFLDIDMPVLDGVSTLERLRSDHPRLPVVCVSGHWEEPTERRVRELGALDAVEKPLSANRLLELVAMAVETRDSNRTL